ncbi:hypothetical protein QO004_004381 [Rhizobium mesoamericanum]|nr:hypothetical protein [Rhizobium mesoamericanum]MDQ0562576.1 hypothetical protein [Rhizobium mesoamericanum]
MSAHHLAATPCDLAGIGIKKILALQELDRRCNQFGNRTVP